MTGEGSQMNSAQMRMRMRDRFRRAAVAGGMGAVLVASGAVAAGAYDPAAAQARYQSERGRCLADSPQQDRNACLREAAAARDEARRSPSATNAGVANYERNALLRCDALPVDDRQACIARMQGEGNRSGSVEQGGIYRELIKREIGAAPAPTPPAPVPLEPQTLPPRP